MKVFVYRKDTSQKVATLEHIEAVEKGKDGLLYFVTESGEAFSAEIKTYKIVIYQN